MIIINEKMPTNCYECWIRNIIVCKCPILTDEEIQKLQELEQAQLEKAFELGKESI